MPSVTTPKPTLPPGAASGYVTRGCGASRIKGGVYVEVNFHPGDAPLEHYLIDEPIPYDTESKLGVTLVDDPQGNTHIIDHVGSTHYPFPADFIEEGRRHGFSRRVARNLDWARINQNTRVLAAHEKAVLANPGTVKPHFNEGELRRRCAIYQRSRDSAHLRDPLTPCTRDWYALPSGSAPGGVRQLTKDTTYRATELPAGVVPQYREGLIASLPITAITVVKAPDDSHLPTLERIRELVKGIPVYEAEA